MNRKLLSTICFFLLAIQVFAQNKNLNFGKVSEAEKNLITYEKDPEAGAVMLYERGDTYFKVNDDKVSMVKEYHAKIKILDEKGFEEGTIAIPLYQNQRSKEKIVKINAVTHNGSEKINLLPKDIYTNDISKNWRETTFTFPNLQKGSILEYHYSISTTFVFTFNGWDFQSSIPKIYSEFNASIPGNYQYNRNLHGSLKLSTNEATIKKDCFQVGRITNKADCEILKYAIKDIPAFNEKEEFMLAPSNYRSRIDFELSEFRSFDGMVKKYTKTWKAVDKEFKTDKDVGRQLTKKGFFEKNVPENLLVEGDELTRARNIYYFVRDHFAWNNKFGVFRKARVKEAFEKRTGSIGEINMTLINLLNSAGINTNLMLLSTRQQGLPKRTHPVMSDFNYFVARAVINGDEYLLDATDKYIPFGYLPFRALNHYGRVMDFKNDSYWQTIVPQKKNTYIVRTFIDFRVEDSKAKGIMDVITTGHNAINARKSRDKINEEDYVEQFEKSISGDFEINSYEHIEKRSDERKVTERFEFEIDNINKEKTVYLNPFFVRFFKKNPFTLEERHFPIDFGYPRNYRYQIILKLPEGYAVKELPESKVINLGEDMATLKFYNNMVNNEISVAFDFQLNATHIPKEDYTSVKNIFKDVVDIQNNSLIVLIKDKVPSNDDQ